MRVFTRVIREHDLPVALSTRDQLMRFTYLRQRQNMAHLHLQLPLPDPLKQALSPIHPLTAVARKSHSGADQTRPASETVTANVSIGLHVSARSAKHHESPE
jgi:hypothetical protein